MKAQELTVEVKANLCVPDETAERCMRLLEMWLNDNRDKEIMGEKQPDGKTRLYIKQWTGLNTCKWRGNVLC